MLLDHNIKTETVSKIIEEYNDCLANGGYDGYPHLSLSFCPGIDWFVKLNVDGVHSEDLSDALSAFEDKKIEEGFQSGYGEADAERELRNLLNIQITHIITSLQFLKDIIELGK
jgi:hypothetical protein